MGFVASFAKITVEDEYGRDPALRLPGTTIMTFPLTMISKRLERGESIDVKELFQGVCEHVCQMRENQDETLKKRG
jgi:hypothetical protein